jgi:hypothetical protein
MTEQQHPYTTARERLAEQMEQHTPLHNCRVAIREAAGYLTTLPPSPQRDSMIRRLMKVLKETEK